MKTSDKIIILLLALAIIIGAILTLQKPQITQLGSVIQGSEYKSVVLTTAVNDLAVLKIGSGALGSAVITVSGTAPFTLYDATSTVTNAEWATTTLASFQTSPTVGTYTFDVIFQKGLLIDYGTGTIPTTTITWR
jgi:hypothetical protein